MQLSEYIELNTLFDTYGALLTERQYAVLSLLLREDLSMTETADRLGITKQAVSDTLSSAKLKLHEYEEKLHTAYMTGRLKAIVLNLQKNEGLSDDAKMLSRELADILKSCEEE